MTGSTNNMKKIILDLCGGTGSWSKPYREAGYDVINVTYPLFDVTKTQFYPEFMCLGDGKNFDTVWFKDVYGILAAPPCTMFSLARTRAKKPRDFYEGMETVEACLKIIWECRKNKKLAFWCLENPRGLLRQFLGKPAFTFQPVEFGEMYTKHTDLWGYFNEPKKLKNPPSLPASREYSLAVNNRILPELPKGYRGKGERNQAARRAMTSPKFAQAFFKANV